jgi:hypothetical protein
MIDFPKIATVILKAIAPAFLIVLFVSGCGGSASSGPTGAAENTNILEVLNTSTSPINQATLPSGTDGISMASFWEKQVLSGFTKSGVLKGYAYEDFKNLTLRTVPSSNPADIKSTLFLITHPDHKAQTGDIVTISGVNQNALDVPFALLNNSFEITRRDANSYFIKVPFATNNREIFLLKANLAYKYLECVGIQTVTQTVAAPTVPVTIFDGYESMVAKYSVENSLNGCSPAMASFTTYKYFAVTNPRPGFSLKYPLLGQKVVNGDFASFYLPFSLPDTPLKSGDTGSIGTLKYYKSSNKAFLTGSSLLSYEILKYTSNAVFIAIYVDTYNDNYNLLSRTTEIYGRDPKLDKDYKLIRTTVKYNNPRRNEVIIE